MYIALNDLVAVMQGSVGNEVTVTIGANNTIQASINKINGSKIVYRAADNSDPENPVAEQSVNAKIAELEEALGDGIDALDADVDAAAVPNSGYDSYAIGVVSGVTEVDGVITAVDTTYVDAAGSATAVKNLVIGANTDTASDDTIYGAKAYADDAVDTAVAGLDADVDAATDVSVTDAEKVAVVTGITEVDGKITAVDSIDVDLAGAATRAKAAVIGASTDAASANTVYGAKAYADSAVSTAVTALDADLDATLGVSDTDPNAIAVVTGVTEVDGVITAVDSAAADAAGSATAAQAAAIAYTDAALT